MFDRILDVVADVMAICGIVLFIICIPWAFIFGGDIMIAKIGLFGVYLIVAGCIVGSVVGR